MSIHGYPDHNGGPEMYDDPESPDRCECGCGEFVGEYAHHVDGLVFVSLRHYQAWSAQGEAADRARVVGEVIDPERTERVTIHLIRCPSCFELMPTLALIEGGHECRKGAA